MADLVSEQYIPGRSEILRDQILTDLRLGALSEGRAEPPIGKSTDNYNLATGVGNVALIGLQNQKVQNDNTNLFTMRGAPLDELLRAEGLPEVVPAGSSGKVKPKIFGPATIADGQPMVLANGTELTVVGNYVGIVNGQEISVVSRSKGKQTNAKGGTAVRFLQAPTNVETNAEVSFSNPLVGGSDAESDERKQKRILNKRRSGPAGSWGHIRGLVLDGDSSISDCYIYPALGGPGSAKIVPVRAMDIEEGEFTRVCTDGQLANARKSIYSVLPDMIELVVQASVDQQVDFGYKIEIPQTSLVSGGGGGWVDAAIWPTLESGDNGVVTIDAVALNGSQITVSALTATAPVALNNNIAWWSAVDRKFKKSLILDVSGSAGAWVLTLQTPFRDDAGDACQVGEYISPAAENIEKYGETWLTLFQGFGPGENSAASGVLQRAFRRPRVSVEDPADWSDSAFSKMPGTYPEITGHERVYASDSAVDVPGSVATGPSVFVPGNFGLYPLL